jgi:hypothetical protein
MTAQTLNPELPRTAAGGVLRRPSREEWIELAERFLDHNYQQCWDYAAMMAGRIGGTVDNVAIYDDGAPIALASVRIKRLPALPTGVAYIAGGPLVRLREEADTAAERFDAALTALRAEYVDRQGLTLRVAPLLGNAEWTAAQAGRCAAAGFTPVGGTRAYTTMLVDVDRPLETIRAGLAQKWRNALNRSERQGLTVVEGTDPALFEDFFPLFDELVSRKGFDVTLRPEFYAQVQERLPETERFHIAIAWSEGRPVAGVVVTIHGDTGTYLLGASNDAGRKTGAAYLLQWNAIQATIRAGGRWYDLGGVDAEGNPGVYKFKLGFNGTELSAPAPCELTPGPVRAALVRGAERAFRALAARRGR